MGNIWDFLIIQPLSWLLLQLYNFTGSYGMAIILFSLVAKVILLPLSAKGKKSMMQTSRLQPKIRELEAKYKNDKEKYQMAVTKLYQDEGVGMMGGCLWSLLPFPIFFALYSVIQHPLANLMKLTQEQISKVAEFFGVVGETGVYLELDLAQQVYNQFDAVKAYLAQAQMPAENLMAINFNFFGINLAEIPSLALHPIIIIPILSAAAAALSGWFTQRMNQKSTKAEDTTQTRRTNLMMNLMMPAMSLWFGFIMPAGMGIYWIANSLFGVAQDYFLTRYYTKIFDAQDAHKADLEERRRKAEEMMRLEAQQRRLEKSGKANENTSKKKRSSKVYKPKGQLPPRSDADAGDGSAQQGEG